MGAMPVETMSVAPAMAPTVPPTPARKVLRFMVAHYREWKASHKQE
jgi:hypothetical protein